MFFISLLLTPKSSGLAPPPPAHLHLQGYVPSSATWEITLSYALASATAPKHPSQCAECPYPAIETFVNKQRLHIHRLEDKEKTSPMPRQRYQERFPARRMDTTHLTHHIKIHNLQGQRVRECVAVRNRGQGLCKCLLA